MKSKWYIVIACAVALLLFLSGWGITKIVVYASKSMKYIANMKVPNSIEQAEDVTGRYYSDFSKINLEDVVPNISSGSYSEASAYNVRVDGKEVQLAVFKCKGDKESKGMFKLCRNYKEGLINKVMTSMDNPKYNYWSSEANGLRIYLWQKKGWVVLIQSSDVKAAKKFQTQFESSL